MTNVATLIPNEKGERRGGRVAGQINRTTRALKLALIEAAELSKHSDGSLRGYCLHLADEHEAVFANLLARLIPVQAKVQVNAERPQRLDPSMSINEMVSAFEMKIKSDYHPPSRLIEHDVIDDVIDGDD